MLRWKCVYISSGRLLKIGKYKADSGGRQCNLLFVFSWEAIKITAKLISPTQTWTEEENGPEVQSALSLCRYPPETGNFSFASVIQMFLSFLFSSWQTWCAHTHHCVVHFKADSCTCSTVCGASAVVCELGFYTAIFSVSWEEPDYTSTWNRIKRPSITQKQQL